MKYSSEKMKIIRYLSTLIMKKLIIFFVLLFSVSICFSQNQLVSDAERFAQLSLNGEVKEMVDYFHPVIIKEMGGKKTVRELIEENNEILKQEGITTLSHEIGEPFNQLNVSGKDFALIPQYITMQTQINKFKVESYLLSISEDGGKSWKFINTGNYPTEKLEELIPEISGKLQIPEKAFETIE